MVKLDAIIKQKHTLNCEECNISCQEIHIKFPSTAPKYKKDRNKNISTVVNQIVKSHKESRGACKELTKNINNVLNDSFTNHFGISFQESYQKCYKFEKKMSPEEKMNTKCAIIMEAVSKINEDNVSTAVDRLYGERQSLRGWDSDRKKKLFESVTEAKKRFLTEKLKVDGSIKKAKNHVGNTDTYNIDKPS